MSQNLNIEMKASGEKTLKKIIQYVNIIGNDIQTQLKDKEIKFEQEVLNNNIILKEYETRNEHAKWNYGEGAKENHIRHLHSIIFYKKKYLGFGKDILCKVNLNLNSYINDNQENISLIITQIIIEYHSKEYYELLKNSIDTQLKKYSLGIKNARIIEEVKFK